MKQITDKLFAVEVPSDAYDFKILKHRPTRSKRLCYNFSKLSFGWIDLKTNDNYKILGTVTKDTIDFDVEGYLENKLFPSGRTYFKHYTLEFHYTEDLQESLRSLLASKGLNPNAKHVIIKQ